MVSLGCVHLIGGPYAVIQVYAWATMLVNYSQETTISEAVVDTFSGEKPCPLCEKIEAAKSSAPEKETPAPAPTPKKLFPDLFASAYFTLSDPIYSLLPKTDFPALVVSFSSTTDGPPTPPPQVLSA